MPRYLATYANHSARRAGLCQWPAALVQPHVCSLHATRAYATVQPAALCEQARRPNCRFEERSVGRAGAWDVRERMLLVATDAGLTLTLTLALALALTLTLNPILTLTLTLTR